jgi:hypothetical protein
LLGLVRIFGLLDQPLHLHPHVASLLLERLHGSPENGSVVGPGHVVGRSRVGDIDLDGFLRSQRGGG